MFALCLAPLITGCRRQAETVVLQPTGRSTLVDRPVADASSRARPGDALRVATFSNKTVAFPGDDGGFAGRTAADERIRSDDPDRKTPTEADAEPVVEVDHDHFDFGTMGPDQVLKHSFEIRNRGLAPLSLKQGTTSCVCTMESLSGDSIPPGGTGSVTLNWHSGESLSRFAHHAEVLTNDPRRPVLTFRVTGEVLCDIAAEPSVILFPRVPPGAREKSSVLLVSQKWDYFEVSNFQCSLEGATWELLPAEDEKLDELHGRSGHRLTVTLPDDLPTGQFQGWMRFRIYPPDASPRDLQIPLQGSVLRRLSLYGSAIDSSGIVHLGVVSDGVATTKSLLVRVRDPETELRVTSVEVEPKFVNVALLPDDKSQIPGTYRLELTIPAGSPCCSYLGTPIGSLHMTFDHPRIHDLWLTLEFAVQDALEMARHR
jgi:hypothetical protein